MKTCPQCHFPLHLHGQPDICPKCDTDLATIHARTPLRVDLAHRGETVATALAKLDHALNQALWENRSQLTIIHGHGSTGTAARIRPAVLDKLRHYATRFDCELIEDPANPGLTTLLLH